MSSLSIYHQHSLNAIGADERTWWRPSGLAKFLGWTRKRASLHLQALVRSGEMIRECINPHVSNKRYKRWQYALKSRLQQQPALPPVGDWVVGFDATGRDPNIVESTAHQQLATSHDATILLQVVNSVNTLVERVMTLGSEWHTPVVELTQAIVRMVEMAVSAEFGPKTGHTDAPLPLQSGINEPENTTESGGNQPPDAPLVAESGGNQAENTAESGSNQPPDAPLVAESGGNQAENDLQSGSNQAVTMTNRAQNTVESGRKRPLIGQLLEEWIMDQQYATHIVNILNNPILSFTRNWDATTLNRLYWHIRTPQSVFQLPDLEADVCTALLWQAYSEKFRKLPTGILKSLPGALHSKIRDLPSDRDGLVAKLPTVEELGLARWILTRGDPLYAAAIIRATNRIGINAYRYSPYANDPSYQPDNHILAVASKVLQNAPALVVWRSGDENRHLDAIMKNYAAAQQAVEEEELLEEALEVQRTIKKANDVLATLYEVGETSERDRNNWQYILENTSDYISDMSLALWQPVVCREINDVLTIELAIQVDANELESRTASELIAGVLQHWLTDRLPTNLPIEVTQLHVIK